MATKDDQAVPRAPKGLGRRGRALWRDLHQTFDFSADPHRQVLIEDAARTADLIDRLQEAADANDLRVRGSQGQPTAAPELGELRQYRALLATLLTKLSLPDTEEMQEIKTAHVAEVRRKAAFKSVEVRRAN